MDILVCGGRDYADYDYLARYLDTLHAIRPVTRLRSGAARGADSLGERWARERGIPVKRFPAEWDRYGRSAGFRRNEQMLRAEGGPDLVVAFPGGNGTAHMVRIAREAGVRVYQV